MDLPGTSLMPERVLWLHVLAQTCIDAASKDKQIKREVKEWLNDEDFEVVCGMAGIRQEYVRSVIMTVLRDKKQKRAFQKAMNFRFLIRSYVESHMGDVDKRRAL